MSYPVTRDGDPSHGRRTCPKCASDAICTIAVPWYPELDYLSCETCHYVWTVARASTHEGPQLPLICVVDEDDSVRVALDPLLRLAGYRTELCDSAENALARETVYQTDCFVIDVHMPGGLALHDILKAMHHPTPVIIVSARADNIRDSAHNAGAFTVIPKPFSPNEVLHAIRAALRLRRAVPVMKRLSPVSTDAAHPRERGEVGGVESARRITRTPMRIQRQRIRGWRLPPDTVYVGRDTKWGSRLMPAHFWWATDRTHAFLEVYRHTITRHVQQNPNFLVPLRGKDLACWCPLDQPCHADVLLDLSNR